MKPLLPLRHAQTDLFICDLFDSFKDDLASMEHPVFSLSTKPDKRVRKYEHNGNTLEIKPGSDGLATIHDKDILLYLASQFMAELNRRQKEAEESGKNNIEAPPQRLRFTAYDYFILTNRDTSKRSYERLENGLDRLTGTRIKTNIKTNGIEKTDNFGILDAFGIIREDQSNPNSRMIGVEVKLSDWFYNSLLGYEVLSISRDYFRLRKPLERRIYELCRKHCGKSDKWEIGLELLRKKTGYSSQLKHFKSAIKDIIEKDHLPDYSLAFDELNSKKIIVRPRSETKAIPQQSGLVLKTQTYENAAKILRGCGLDKYAVYQEWAEWIRDKEPPASPDGAYIGFCKMKIASL